MYSRASSEIRKKARREWIFESISIMDLLSILRCIGEVRAARTSVYTYTCTASTDLSPLLRHMGIMVVDRDKSIPVCERDTFDNRSRRNHVRVRLFSLRACT